ncbi:H-NS family nucleoid-associated regulatory protein [Roseateles chitinivorans]|uniref:H-NS histone family protein n=1 Tax=Roseateles chitinivorans TaxID=2917965 RepID=UPI003D667F84
MHGCQRGRNVRGTPVLQLGPPCHSFTDMPKRSLRQVLDQIEVLQREAAELRAREVEEVIDRIQEAIEHYGLTPKDLFSPKRRASKAAVAPPKKVRRSGAVVAKRAAGRRLGAGVPKYADPSGSGKTWTGQGKRPGWFVAALDGGKAAEELLIK